MTVTYHAGRRVQGTSIDLSVSTDLTGWNTSTWTASSSTSNTITKSGNNAWGDQKAQSTKEFTVGSNLFAFEFSPSASGTTAFIGLGQGTLTQNNASGGRLADSMKFGYFIAGESKVYEYDGAGGSLKNTQASFNASDIYRITVDIDGTVKYYRQASGSGNFNLEYTSTTSASGTYYLQVNIYTNTVGFTDIKYSSGKPINAQVGSRFEETDTRKMYYRDDVDFKELDGNEATNYRSESWYEQLSGESP